MKEFIHKQNNSEICIYEHSENKVRGSFFNEKPQPGDLIMSHNKRETNFLYVYRVVSIDKVRDARIASDCGRDPKGAYLDITVENVTYNSSYSEVDNSIDRIEFL